MSVHLSAILDFVNIFIRYRLRHRISELSVMATEMVSIRFFFLVKKLLLQHKNLSKFHKCLLKAYTLHTY